MTLPVVVALVMIVDLKSLWVTQSVNAGASDVLSGYAWSDTIGWISFNCTNTATCGTSSYGVTVAAGGAMSGYAWSDNIGWISFNPGDVLGCPSGTCSPTMNQTTGAVSGWAKALSGSVVSGWDGWISLSGVTVSNCAWGGYAWGSDVVGWINFGGNGGTVTGTDDGCVTPPTGSISATPSTPPALNGGSTTTVTWSASGASSCEVSSIEAFNTDSWTGLSDNKVSSPLYADTTYVLVCDGIPLDSVSLVVDNTPELNSSHRMVEEGGTVTLSWDTNNGDETLCTLSGGNIIGNPLSPTTGDVNTGTYEVVVSARTTYTVQCLGGIDTSIVEVIPRGFES